MRIRPDEPYEEWAKRVQMYEHGYALQQIAEGKDPNLVLEEMSKRIMEKLLHPMYKMIMTVRAEDTEQMLAESKQRYEEYYVNRIGPRADHVIDDGSSVKTNQLGNTKE
jgi:hypothetical protein